MCYVRWTDTKQHGHNVQKHVAQALAFPIYRVLLHPVIIVHAKDHDVQKWQHTCAVFRNVTFWLVLYLTTKFLKCGKGPLCMNMLSFSKHTWTCMFYMCILAQNAQRSSSISDQWYLFAGNALQAKIRRCCLHPSSFANDEVEGVYLATLGHRSQQWLRSLKAERIVQEARAEN